MKNANNNKKNDNSYGNNINDKFLDSYEIQIVQKLFPNTPINIDKYDL